MKKSLRKHSRNFAPSSFLDIKVMFQALFHANGPNPPTEKKKEGRKKNMSSSHDPRYNSWNLFCKHKHGFGDETMREQWAQQTPEQKVAWKKMATRDPSLARLNPYILFFNTVRGDILAQRPDLSAKKVAAQAGALWRALNNEEKDFWRDQHQLIFARSQR
jgi:hypothetical protein